MNEDARRCALPGCEAMITDIPGRPPRRYCTAAHRASARQTRRASAHPAPEQRLAEVLPWLRDPDVPRPRPRPRPSAADPGWAPTPTGAGAPAAAARVAARRARAARRDEPLPRNRRALAVLGVAGILAGGYAVTVSDSDTSAAGPPAQAAPSPESEDQWADRARFTLTSVNRQLDVIAQTEEAWNRLPQSRRPGSAPAPVRAMKDRKALLESRRATLQSQLDAYRSLRETQTELQLAEQHLRAVEKAMRDAPSEQARSPERAALDVQRDMRIRERDAKREELASLANGVQSAKRSPLPDDGEQTTDVSKKVLGVIRDGGQKDRDPASDPQRPDVVGGREERDGRPRQDASTSGPPDPRGPGDVTEERRRARGEQGPVGAVVDTVGGVLVGGDKGKQDQAGKPKDPPKDTPRDPKPAAGDRAPGKEVPARSAGSGSGALVATVDKVLDGPSDRPPNDAASSRSAAASTGRAAPPPSADVEAPPARTTRPALPARRPGGAGGSGIPRTARAAPAGVPGMGVAGAMIGSVPGGQLAAPAMDAAMGEAAASGGGTGSRPTGGAGSGSSDAEPAAPRRAAVQPKAAPRQRSIPSSSAMVPRSASPLSSRAQSSDVFRSAQRAQSSGSTRGAQRLQGSAQAQRVFDGGSSQDDDSGVAMTSSG